MTERRLPLLTRENLPKLPALDPASLHRSKLDDPSSQEVRRHVARLAQGRYAGFDEVLDPLIVGRLEGLQALVEPQTGGLELLGNIGAALARIRDLRASFRRAGDGQPVILNELLDRALESERAIAHGPLSRFLAEEGRRARAGDAHAARLTEIGRQLIESQRRDREASRAITEAMDHALGASAQSRLLLGDLLKPGATPQERAAFLAPTVDQAAHIRMWELLQEALADPAIASSSRVSGLVRALRDRLDRVVPGKLDEESMFSEAIQKAKSADKASIAKAKNAEEREWVRQQWRDRVDTGQSKASFARQHAALVKEKFGKKVGAEQIQRKWLEGL